MPTVCRRQRTDRFTLLRKRMFNDVMTSASSGAGAAIAAAHDFSGYRRIVDVGGGHGALLAPGLDRYPGPSGVLFDLPNSNGPGRRSLSRRDCYSKRHG
jgi:hypothetical protein